MDLADLIRWHEAGHAALILLLLRPEDMIECTATPKVGFTMYQFPDAEMLGRLFDRSDEEIQIFVVMFGSVFMAGKEAERLMCGQEPDIISYRDDQENLETLLEFAYGITPEHPAFNSRVAAINGYARRFLEQQYALLEAIAAALLKKHRLSREELIELRDQHMVNAT